MTDKTVIEMPPAVLENLIRLNNEAVAAVSPVGGNSVQDGYKNATLEVLAKQRGALEVFMTDEPTGD